MGFFEELIDQNAMDLRSAKRRKDTEFEAICLDLQLYLEAVLLYAQINNIPELLA